MTQADKANEGREEKQPYFKLSKNEYGKMWLFYNPEGNGSTGRYKYWEPINGEFWNEFEQLLSLRDQLSERQQQLDASLRNTTRLLDQLSKEREMRKDELKQAFNAGRNYQRGEMGVWHGAPDHDYPDFKQWYESLIAKATELDKK